MRPSISQSIGIDTLLNRSGPARKTVFFRKRQIIFSVGNRSDSVFVVERGTASSRLHRSKGKRLWSLF
jgi:hypothetical protein